MSSPVTDTYTVKTMPKRYMPLKPLDVWVDAVLNEDLQANLIGQWMELEHRTEHGDSLANQLAGVLVRCGNTGRSNNRVARSLFGRLRTEYNAVKIINELFAFAKPLNNGDTATIVSPTTDFVLFMLMNPEGGFVGLTEMNDTMEEPIDGVPVYLYRADISAFGWRGLCINEHLVKLIRRAMALGVVSVGCTTNAEVVYIPELVTVMPKHYALGEISMEEVKAGVESSFTRPILIQ